MSDRARPVASRAHRTRQPANRATGRASDVRGANRPPSQTPGHPSPGPPHAPPTHTSPGRAGHRAGHCPGPHRPRQADPTAVSARPCRPRAAPSPAKHRHSGLCRGPRSPGRATVTSGRAADLSGLSFVPVPRATSRHASGSHAPIRAEGAAGPPRRVFSPATTSMAEKCLVDAPFTSCSEPSATGKPDGPPIALEMGSGCRNGDNSAEVRRRRGSGATPCGGGASCR